MKYPLILVAVLAVAGCQTQQQAPQAPQPPASAGGGPGDSAPSPAARPSADQTADRDDGSDPGSAQATSPPSPGQSGSMETTTGAYPLEDIPGSDTARAGSETIGDDMDPGAGVAGGSQSAWPGSGGDAVTSDEQIEMLDGQLSESLAGFDAMILGERAAIAAIANSLPASATQRHGTVEDDGDHGAGGGGPLFVEGDLSEPAGVIAGTGDGDGESGDDHEGDARATASRTAAGVAAGGRSHGEVPPDLVDGSDDDIVARQIREAAMNEPDPELREKLWDEYRRYKQGG